MTSAQTEELLAMSMLRGVGPGTLRKVLRKSESQLLDIKELAESIKALSKALEQPGAWNEAQSAAREQVVAAQKLEARILSPLDNGYPPLLVDSRDDPVLLFVRGALAKCPDKSVAIIGTREPTRHGVIITERITRFFVEQGWSVISGLALGCDAIAHQVALDAGGHTVAVLAHGLQTIAPARHQKLADDIVDSGGALVTQYPIGRDAISQQFAQRDKTQAGLAKGVVMIQSDLKGGSLLASRAALGYGRWLAVPFPTSEDLAGDGSKIQANLMLAEGSTSDKANLMRLTDDDSLSRLIILRSKDDYSRCLEAS